MARGRIIRPLGTSPAATRAPSSVGLVPKTWLKEPRLMVPGMMPLGPVRIDWNASLTRGLKRCFVYGGDWCFHELVSNVLWGRNTAFTPSVNRYGPAVIAYNAPGTSTNTVLISPESLNRHTFVTVGYIKEIVSSTDALYLSQRTVDFKDSIGYFNSSTSIRAAAEGVSHASGSMFSAGDAVSIAFSRDQVDALCESVFCKNFSATVVQGPTAMSGITTYDGDERYYLAKSGTNAQPLMCLMEFARVLPTQEKISIVKDPYQFLIPA